MRLRLRATRLMSVCTQVEAKLGRRVSSGSLVNERAVPALSTSSTSTPLLVPAFFIRIRRHRHVLLSVRMSKFDTDYRSYLLSQCQHQYQCHDLSPIGEHARVKVNNYGARYPEGGLFREDSMEAHPPRPSATPKRHLLLEHHLSSGSNAAAWNQ